MSGFYGENITLIYRRVDELERAVNALTYRLEQALKRIDDLEDLYPEHPLVSSPPYEPSRSQERTL